MSLSFRCPFFPCRAAPVQRVNRTGAAGAAEYPVKPVRVIVPFVGGGYGGKNHARIEPVVAIHQRFGAPVRKRHGASVGPLLWCARRYAVQDLESPEVVSNPYPFFDEWRRAGKALYHDSVLLEISNDVRVLKVAGGSQEVLRNYIARRIGDQTMTWNTSDRKSVV